MRNTRRIAVYLLSLLTVVGAVLGFAACTPEDDCEHQWVEATCTAPKTCSLCDETEGAALGHSGGTASCTEQAVCAVCNTAYGELAAHDWVAATCTEPKHCASCSATEGEAGHTYGAWVSNGNGTHTKTCSADSTHTETESCSGGTATTSQRAVCQGCGAEYGELKDHTYGAWVPNGNGTHTKTSQEDPTHQITENCSGGTASCTAKAICKDCETAYGPEPSHNYTQAVTEPTCTTDGYTTHTCQVSGCGHSYVDSNVTAKGHKWVGAVTCTTGRSCENCTETDDALGHDYSPSGSTPADCLNPLTNTYRCGRSGCGHEYEETVGTALGHDLSGVTPREVPVSGCEYKQVSACKRCAKDIDGETIYKHTYVASVTKEATCVADGEKTLTCSACRDVQTEVIEKNENSHKWDAGVLSGNIRTYTCLNTPCQAQKTAVDASSSSSAEVKADDLANAGGVQLNNAGMKFDDDALNTLKDKDVTISSGTLQGTQLQDAINSLTPAQQQQLGANPTIYNFTVEHNNTAISEFNGKVTVTLPYTLAPGEDVDSIAVWYMSGGTPVSIEAVYSNGYITFETDHFSYYTVTKLTPAERCELYGHNYSTKTVIGTCTTDGYELKVCVRCHDTVKTITSVADGHDYAEVTENATCTKDGKTVYTCADCKHTYQIRIPAIGHSINEVERQDATCALSGYVKYACEREGCGAAYNELIEKLPHVYTATVVPATCETDGYTLHECQNCEYFYKSAIVAAFGHDYEIAWTRNADNTGAGAVLTCANDGTHRVELTVTVTANTTDATCTEAGKTVYTASATYAGVNYTDAWEIEIAAKGHTYATAWEHNTNGHWHNCEACGAASELLAHAFDTEKVLTEATCAVAGEKQLTCVCGESKTEAIPATGAHIYENRVCKTCGKSDDTCDHIGTTEWKHTEAGHWQECTACDGYKTDVSAHAYTNVEIVKVATCTEAGEQKLICVCGDFKTEPIAATGLHSFENGVCTGCGKAETVACDHTELRTVTVNVADYGCCGGSFVYKTCACGEVILLDEEKMLVDCDMSNFGDTKQGVDENGEAYVSMSVSCADCSFHATVIAYIKQNGCLIEERMIYGFYAGETVILENAVLEYAFDNHDTELATISLDEFSDCGTVLWVQKCTECGEIVDFNGFDKTGCKLTENEYTELDENGVEHLIYIIECEVCSFKIVTDETEEQETTCSTRETYTISFYNGEEVFLELKDEWTNTRHDYEYTYKLLGDSCTEGYTYEASCKNCDSSYSDSGSGHMTDRVTEKIEADGYCGAEIIGDKCRICNTYTYYFFTKQNCSFDVYAPLDPDIDYGSNDNVTVVPEYKDYVAPNYSVGEVAGSVTGSYTDATVAPEYKDYVAPNYSVGEAAGSVTGSYTDVTVGDLTVSVPSTDSDFVVTPGVGGDIVVTPGIGGIIGGVSGGQTGTTTQTCTKCGATVETESWIEQESACVQTQFTKRTVIFQGEAIWEGISESGIESHQYETRYELRGDSCEDGYMVYQTCTACNMTNEWYGSGHYEVHEKIDLSEYSSCGGYLYVEVCEICEQMRNYEIDTRCEFLMGWMGDEETDENGVVHQIEWATCERCRITYSLDTWGETEVDCKVTGFVKLLVEQEGKVLYEITGTTSYSNHDIQISYEFNEGGNCEYGYTVYKYCAKCDYEDSYEDAGHITDNTWVDLYEYGLCGGELALEYCELCEQIVYINSEHDGCRWVNRADANGNAIEGRYVCKRCGAEKIEIEERTESDENCRYTASYTLIYRVNNAEVYRITIENTYTEHRFETTYTLRGDNCDDGYTVHQVCSVCNKEESWTSGGHLTYRNELYLEDYTDAGCNGSILYSECEICHLQKFDHYKLSCRLEKITEEATDENGVLHTVLVEKCAICGLTVRTESREQLFENCEVYTEQTISFTLDNTEIITFNMTDYGEKHDIEKVVEFYGNGCDDGGTEYEYCTRCDNYRTGTWEFYGHDTTYEIIDLSEYGCCGGHVEIETCLRCERIVSANNYLNCKMQDVETEGEGISKAVCEICGMESVSTWGYVDTEKPCERIYETTSSLMLNGEVIYSYTNSNIETAHDITHSFNLYGESCDDGYMVREYCTKCDYEHSYETRGHHNYQIKYIYLGEVGACEGSYYWLQSCACGENISADLKCCGNYTYNKIPDPDNPDKMQEVEVYACDQCGLRAQKTLTETTVPEECAVKYQVAVVFTLNGALIDEYQYEGQYTSHTYESSYELFEGATSCKQGVICTNKCKFCGEGSTDYFYHHVEGIVLEQVDLSELGSECGGVMTQYACPCGESTKEMSIDDAYCHFDTEYAESWIENAIDGNFIDYVCAVTEIESKPCGFRIRYAHYYVAGEEPCTVVGYTTWQFGYDPQTGTCAKEITYATGNAWIRHSYEQTEINTTENGLTVTGWHNECKQCGSYEDDKYYFDANGRQVKHEKSGENKLMKNPTDLQSWRDCYENTYVQLPDGGEVGYRSYETNMYKYWNGEERYHEFSWQRDYSLEAPFGKNAYIEIYSYRNSEGGSETVTRHYTTYFDLEYELYYRSEGVKSEGDSYWSERINTYNFEDGCHVIEEWSDSNGNTGTNEYERHNTVYVENHEYTCTQGTGFREYCRVCQTEFSNKETEPRGHHWEYDAQIEMYVCVYCGLENLNGADGDIIMEDLTEKYGEGDSYVVGFWNRNKVEYTYYVCLTLLNASADQDDQVILEGEGMVSQHERLRAMVINKAMVEAAAAELGYTADEYDVTFVFVPYGGDSSYDYAITFTK